MLKRVVSDQANLFPINARKYAERLGLNWWAVKKLHDDGWLSFDPDTTQMDNSVLEAEFTFLTHLIAAGCEPLFLTRLLSHLKKPYTYNFSEIYFDWRSATWRNFPEEKSIDMLLEEVIEESAEDNDTELLTSLRERIEDAIDEIELGDLKSEDD